MLAAQIQTQLAGLLNRKTAADKVSTLLQILLRTTELEVVHIYDQD